MADPACGFIEHLAYRVLQAALAANDVYHSQCAAIRSPVSILYVIQQVAGPVSADGELSQGANMRETIVADAEAAQDRHLPGCGDCQHLGLREPQFARFGRVWRTDKDGLRTTFPGSTINGRAWVRSKASCRQSAP